MLLLFSTSATAQTLELVDVDFSSDKYGLSGILGLTVKNNSDREIIAWKGILTCYDALGDLAFKTKLKSRSANIKPRQTEVGKWEVEMFTSVHNVVMNNDADNFDCSLDDVKVAQ